MFIGEITDMEVLSDIPSATYEYYQNHIKPRPQAIGKDRIGTDYIEMQDLRLRIYWRRITGELCMSFMQTPASDFEKIVKKEEKKEMAGNKYVGTQTEKNLQEAFQANPRQEIVYLFRFCRKEGRL